MLYRIFNINRNFLKLKLQNIKLQLQLSEVKILN